MCHENEGGGCGCRKHCWSEAERARAVYWICKKVLLWRGLEEDKKSRDKKVPSGRYQHLAPLCLCYSFEFTFPCFTLFFSVLEKSRHLALLCYNLLLEIPHHLAPICLASSHFISVLQYFYTLLCIAHRKAYQWWPPPSQILQLTSGIVT